MKSLFMFFIILSTSLSVFASPSQIINCRYNSEENANLTIHLNGAGGAFVIYRSDKTSKPVTFGVREIYYQSQNLIIEGELPAPWTEDSFYKISLSENYINSSITYYNSQDSSQINMVCLKH